MKSTVNLVQMREEQPPSLNYVIRLATADEIVNIVKNLQIFERQTMNFRMMPDAKALVLFDRDNMNKIIGWQGFTLKGFNDIPEKFSLHLDLAYRSFLLGLALETVLYKYLDQSGLNYTILRMDRNGTESLMNYRTTTGVVKEILPKEMPKEWLSMCGNCELYKKTCMQQSFFKVYIRKGIELGEKRLGAIGELKFPVQIKLEENQIRKVERKFLAKWAV